MLDPLAGDEHLAVELDACRTGRVGDEELPADRHHHPRTGTEAVRVHGHVTPAEHAQALVDDDRADGFLGLLGVRHVEGQERQTDGVGAGEREIEVDNPAQESIRHLDQDAGSIAGIGFGAGGAAVLQVAERAKAHGHDRSAGHALHVRDERDAASVVFEPRVIETLRRGKPRLRVIAHRFGSTESVNG